VFVKEVLDFNSCATIIAFDYKNLLRNDAINSEYLEKFIATKIQLTSIPFHEIIEFHINEILGKVIEDAKSITLLQNIRMLLHENIYKYYANIEERIAKYREKEEARTEKKALDNHENNSITLDAFNSIYNEKKKCVDN